MNPPRSSTVHTAAALPNVEPLDQERLARAWAELDQKTKPPRSLGRFEALIARYIAVRAEAISATWQPVVVVMASDHGVANSAVSAYPQAVTVQMLHNFARGGAAINALCRAAGAELVVVDVGTLGPTPAGVRDQRVRAGSRNFELEPALDQSEVRQAFEVGLALASELHARGTTLVALGEMGIGNTTVASALTAVFAGKDPSDVVGRGTGVSDEGLAKKCEVVARALRLHEPDRTRPWDVLAKVGGLEVIALAGLCVGSASLGLPVLLDGFITGSAALAAQALCPNVTDYLFAAHRSSEPGHDFALQQLGLEPLLSWDLRLGEGSGAALCLPMFKAAIHLWHEMATFASAGVSTAS
jgi:nicotinate-nucleotide--dimethylbenzimidazole phosphoribosyltransferase